MAYEFLCDNCEGCHTKFIEQNGKFPHKRVGKLYSGSLALQTFEDRNYMRITFADGKNVWGGAIKKIFGMSSGVYKNDPWKAYSAANKDYLCHFDFSMEELRTGRKKVEYWISIPFPIRFCLEFYDFSDYTGRCYFFPDKNEADKWARRLGIKTIKLFNMAGEEEGELPLEDE